MSNERLATAQDTRELNRYHARKFSQGKKVGRIGTKGRLCKELGLPQSTLDQWELRHPALFPKPIYKVKNTVGEGFRYYYSVMEIENFVADKVSGRVKAYREIVERVALRSGQSKYGAVLERLGVESEVK